MVKSVVSVLKLKFQLMCKVAQRNIKSESEHLIQRLKNYNPN